MSCELLAFTGKQVIILIEMLRHGSVALQVPLLFTPSAVKRKGGVLLRRWSMTWEASVK